ncbi:hypothetical protein AMTR_s00027p00241910 [Amborella trichopoda]|uniref:Uncharacterized protein n=1 Tax=Amborella trichopoda TaxID=13333 RepID=W1PT05_AMBTC|nr:hypothetical protein AMTR_s00027p00241910 [Amborella trichopoda]
MLPSGAHFPQNSGSRGHSAQSIAKTPLSVKSRGDAAQLRPHRPKVHESKGSLAKLAAHSTSSSKSKSGAAQLGARHPPLQKSKSEGGGAGIYTIGNTSAPPNAPNSQGQVDPSLPPQGESLIKSHRDPQKSHSMGSNSQNPSHHSSSNKGMHPEIHQFNQEASSVVITMIEDKLLKGDLQVQNHKGIQENLSVSPWDHAIFKSKEVVVNKDSCINMISINRDCTPSQDEKAENPGESRRSVIVVASKNPQEVDHLTRRQSHFKPSRLMADTLEERLGNLPKVDQNPSMPNETTKE